MPDAAATQVAETPKAARRVSVTSVASVFEPAAEGCGGSLGQRREATHGFRALPGLWPLRTLCLDPGRWASRQAEEYIEASAN